MEHSYGHHPAPGTPQRPTPAMPGAEVAKQAGDPRWPLLFLLRSRPGQYRGETDLPFVTACFVISSSLRHTLFASVHAWLNV